MKKIMTITLALFLLVGCTKGNDSSKFKPGTYNATGTGFGGEITVTITTDESKITDVVIVGENETPTVGGAALEELKGQILKAQSADIDGVSGATLTSNGVKEATAKAIESAKGSSTVNTNLKDGEYTATMPGFQEGYETVKVVVENNAIKEVTIVESTDYPVTVTKAPTTQIPAAIVENQTYNVDSVTGATLTSNAIKMAVKDCLDQAGGSDAFSKTVEHTSIQKEDVQTDVLVIGAGGSGMMAAIEASIGEKADESSNLNVTLIEKAGFVGGITSLSGGVRYFYDDETHTYDDAWVEACLENEKAALSKSMDHEFNEELLRNEIKINPHANELLKEIGVVSEDAWGYVQFASNDGHEDPKWRGSYYTYVVGPYVENSDIDLRLNTAATHLVTDDHGAIIGAQVEDLEGTYTIYAKKVILSTGGFAQNLDLVKKYAPEFEKGIVFSSGTNDGDGIIMGEEINAQIVGNKMMGHIGADGNVGCRPDFGGAVYYGFNQHPFVNMEGKRFVNEDKSKYQIYEDVLNQPELTAWAILDSDDQLAEALEASTSEYVHKADTLEELAKELNIPYDTLQQTIDAWNAAVEAGEDQEFGTSIDRMSKVDKGPYYAYILRPITMTSEVGLKVDGNCHVLDVNGKVIENLFATGDVIMGGNIVTYYFDARGVGTAIYSGTLSGQTAKNEIINAD